MLLSILKKSYEVSLKEWKYYLSAAIMYYFNIGALSSYNAYHNTPSFLLSVFSILLTIYSFMLLFGKVTRRVYDLEPFGLSKLLKESFFASLSLYVYLSLASIVVYPIKELLPLPTIMWITHIILYFVLLISYLLEIIKVYFLEKEIFSLYSVFKRIIDKKYLFDLFLLSVLTVTIYVLFKMALSYFGSYVYFLYVFINVFLSIVYLITFLYVFDFKEDAYYKEGIEL